MKRRSGRIDRISSLPDVVLAHVLSFVSTRDAVRTCVLSKRWRNTWTIVPVLNFDFDEFPTELVSEDDDDDINENIKEELKFDSFVCSALENRGPSHVDTVTFTGEFMDHFCQPSMRWLHRAALLMPQVISAMIPYFELEELNLPDSLFSCSRLELLELIHCPYVGGKAYLKQNSITLTSLKTLMLVNLIIDDDFAQKLLLGCPVLEDLQLFNCELLISDISSNVLKELILDNCWLLRHIQISCPVLVSLFISSHNNSIRIVSLENMTSLVYATIILCGSDEKVVGNLPKLKLLGGLSNATSLQLRFLPLPELKVQLENEISNCGKFYNLNCLDIGAWNMVKHFSLVALFLEHSPVLKQLALSLNRDVIQEMPGRDVSFQLEYIETVNIFSDEKKLASKLVRLLGRHVKTMGNINFKKFLDG